MKSSKSLLFSILSIISLFLISCRKDALENNEKNNSQNENSVNSSVSNTGTEKMMEFAAQTPNPYTLQNMQAALSSLAERNLSQCNLSRFVVRTTHKYIKFKPEDSIQIGLLIQDTSLILFDYPMDRKIIRGGTYYRDPSIPVGKPSYQWTCVKVEKVLPSGIPFELLSNLYVPEEDPNLIQYYETPFDDCITLLIEEALKRTGNYDTTTYTINMKNGGESNTSFLPSKWTPKGCIKLSDNILNTTTGLRGAKARAHRWFETREGLTNENGNFDVGHKFRFPVDYSIKWERNDFNIRSGTSGQAYYNGPHHRGDWNLDITGGVSWHYGQVHRGAFDYYYNNQTGLRKPPTNGFLGARIAIGVFDKGDRANYRHWQRNWFGPEIQLYSKWQDNSSRSAQNQYTTTIHELAHASHFNMSHSDYRNTKEMVQESWAVGVAWTFAKLKYPSPLDLQSLKLQNGVLISGTSVAYDVIDWGERQYTSLVVDLVDNNNQRVNYGGNIDFPIDNVSGYTIRNIENALNTKRTMDTWRDQLKTTKPTGVTNSQLDELFLNFTPLQKP